MEKKLQAILKFARLLFFVFRKGYFKPRAKKLSHFGENEKCFVLGNGPSLLKELGKVEDDLTNNDVFVVNHFAETIYYEKFKPSFYLLIDPVFWDNKTKYGPGLEVAERKVIDTILKKTSWSIHVLVPFMARDSFEDLFKSNSNIKVIDFNNIGFETGTKLDHLLYSKFYASPHIQNVLVAAIFLAINFGFKEINVLGFDHSWLEYLRVNAENEVCLIDKHFYDKNQDKKLTPFYKIYGGIYTMHEVLIDHAKMFYGYHIVSKYGKIKNTKIYNCTEASYVDAFDRKIL